jgi:hypothetical protein
MPTTDLVLVHGRGIRVDRRRTDIPIAEARHRYGGLGLLAALGGGVAGLGTAAALSAAAAAGLSFAYAQGAERGALKVAGCAAAIAVLALAGLYAGWVAGRAGRYDGGSNGSLAGVIALLLVAGAVLLGASQDQLLDTSALPAWVRDAASGQRALLVAGIGTALGLLLSAAGGSAGARWHRRADEALLDTRDGGISPSIEDEVVRR